MAWKDYETLDLTPEKVTEEEMQKLYLKEGIENDKERWSGLNGGKQTSWKRNTLEYCFII